MLGLQQVRTVVSQGIQAEMLKLKESLHSAHLGLEKKQIRLHEERERLKFVKRKCTEEAGIHNRAEQEYARARGILMNALADNAGATSSEEMVEQGRYITNCESLCDSWAVNRNVAKLSLDAWQFKTQQEIAACSRGTNELAAAEEAHDDAVANIALRESQLKALSDLLMEL